MTQNRVKLEDRGHETRCLIDHCLMIDDRARKELFLRNVLRVVATEERRIEGMTQEAVLSELETVMGAMSQQWDRFRSGD